MNAEWFQQDGATLHLANEALKMLTEAFADRITSRRARNVLSTNSTKLDHVTFSCGGTFRTKCKGSIP